MQSISDEYGRIEVVERAGGERSLFFGSTVEQCRMDPRTGWPAFEYTRWQALAPAFAASSARPAALVLGLGGGALTRTLFDRNPGLKLTVVELREAVVDLAYEAFELPVDKGLEVYVADAGVFLAEVDRDWDVIASDLFDADGIANQSDDSAFYEACAVRMTPGGVFAINLWRVNMKRFWRSLKRLAEVFKGRLLCADMDDANSVIFAFGASVDLGQLSEEPQVIRQAAALGLNLTRMIPYGAYRKK